eukprot:5604560-Amphidinium_carterae.1
MLRSTGLASAFLIAVALEGIPARPADRTALVPTSCTCAHTYSCFCGFSYPLGYSGATVQCKHGYESI